MLTVLLHHYEESERDGAGPTTAQDQHWRNGARHSEGYQVLPKPSCRFSIPRYGMISIGVASCRRRPRRPTTRSRAL